ncbi:MAG: MATE family efflux transporter, partial [Oceanobacter sp.]
SLGFLRMGTTALAARSRDNQQLQETLFHGLWTTLPLTLVLMTVGFGLLPQLLGLIDMKPELAAETLNYLSIRLFSIPAVLVQYVLLGWFIGQGLTRVPLIMMVSANLANAGLDYLFVYGLDMTADGVALGSLMADYFSVFVGLWILRRHAISLLDIRHNRPDGKAMKSLVKVNGDLFVRTLLLLSVIAFFNAMGASQGELVLATNAVMMTLLMLISNALDGFAHAAESLLGKSLVQRQFEQSRRVIVLTGVNSLALALGLLAGFALFSDTVFQLLTNNSALLPLLNDYLVFLILLPLVGFGSYWLDGICLAAGASDQMRNAMIFSVFLVFLPVWWATLIWGNSGLWLAFYGFLIARVLFVLPLLWRLFRQPDSYVPSD